MDLEKDILKMALEMSKAKIHDLSIQLHADEGLVTMYRLEKKEVEGEEKDVSVKYEYFIEPLMKELKNIKFGTKKENMPIQLQKLVLKYTTN